MKVYVPNYDSNDCVVIRDSNTIRVYDSTPTYNSTIAYKDYFLHSNYYSVSGVSQFTQYSTIPTCVPHSDLTSEYGYSVDFPVSCICALCIIFLGYFLISKCVRTVFVDWRYC